MIWHPKDARKNFFNFHWPMLAIWLVLILIGLLNLYSATSHQAGAVAGYFYSQLIWLGLGALVTFLLVWTDYRYFEAVAYPVYGVTLVLLVLVLIFGKSFSGQQNWLVVGGLRLQPAEFAKLGLIFVLAKFFKREAHAKFYSWREIKIPLLLMLLPFVLILGVGDIGNALFFLSIGGTYFAMVGVQRKILLLLIGMALIAGGVGYKFFLKNYQRARILTFLNPEQDPKGKGYHLLQSKIAVGSGKIFGKGYRKGHLNKLAYLPERHTDFVFSVLAEEWGFVGGLTLLSLYAMLLWMLLSASAHAKERFGALILLGVVSLFFWHIIINLGGVLGLLPLTGVPLPLLSYGGSSVLTFSIAMGLAFSIHMKRHVF
ncbi:MAG: rod shape-determining protein RodA [Deltaproteobacteria bacterium]|nr:rod shape-determining protein RodA [Deltaproteobacteria bacterium]